MRRACLFLALTLLTTVLAPGTAAAWAAPRAAGLRAAVVAPQLQRQLNAAGVTHAVAVTLVVSPRDFALSVRPSSVTVTRGQSAKYTVDVSVIGGSAGKVSLAVAGLPAGTMAVLSPNPVGAPGSSALTVKTTSSTRRGTYTLRITGTRGSLVHTATATLTVR
jgi:hypothetical protein